MEREEEGEREKKRVRDGERNYIPHVQTYKTIAAEKKHVREESERGWGEREGGAP